MAATSRISSTTLMALLVVAGCSSSNGRDSQPTSTTQSTSTPTSATVLASTEPTTVPAAVDPNAPEIVQPGDIPDNQTFIPFTDPGRRYTVKVPEGWARTEANGVVTFTDKYNSITLRSSTSNLAPTTDSVKSDGLADVAHDPTFGFFEIKRISRKAGTAIRVLYEIGSAPNPVTGKKALLAVERYVFFHNGTIVTMTLSGAKGADNVDPWKIVSDSLTWK